MEWVETTAKTVAEAQDLALDQLGILAEDAEIEVVEEPKPGLFGRVRGNARVKARVRPTAPPAKQERGRRKGRGRDGGGSADSGDTSSSDSTTASKEPASKAPVSTDSPSKESGGSGSSRSSGDRDRNNNSGGRRDSRSSSDDAPRKERPMMPETEQREAGETFLTGLLEAFDLTAEVSSDLDEDGILSFAVDGDNLGLLIGPGLNTLDSIQEVCRNAIQRQADGREYGKVVLDVSGVRAERTAALEAFVRTEAEKVLEDGEDVIFDTMSRSDRKIVHDVVGEFEGLATESVGEDPRRRVVLRQA